MTKNSADYWIKKLKLIHHPEGGYYKEIFRSDKKIKYRNKKYSYYSTIYYLLKSEDVSVFHKLKFDEIWNHYYGSPVTIFSITKENKVVKNILGKNVDKGQKFQIRIPANTWFAASIQTKN